MTVPAITKRRSFKRRAVDYLGGACKACGLRTNLLPLYAFHHRNPAEKTIDVSIPINRKDWKLLRSEIDKCDLLCSNCHIKVHALLDGWPIEDFDQADPVLLYVSPPKTPPTEFVQLAR